MESNSYKAIILTYSVAENRCIESPFTDDNGNVCWFTLLSAGH